MKMVAEGVRTNGAALALGARHGVELPIATQMQAVLSGQSDVGTAIAALMLRRPRAEAEASMGLFDKLKAGLARTKQNIVERFDEIVRSADAPERRSRPIDVETVGALEELLISADIGVAATDRIIAAVSKSSRNGTGLRDLVKRQI